MLPAPPLPGHQSHDALRSGDLPSGPATTCTVINVGECPPAWAMRQSRRQRASKLVLRPLASATPATETSEHSVCSTNSRLNGADKLRRLPLLGEIAITDCSCVAMLVLAKLKTNEHAALLNHAKNAVVGRLRRGCEIVRLQFIKKF
jgi:hypothetical protein